MQIVTGYTGEPHITSSQDRAIHQGIIGGGSYILSTGSQMAATAASANEVRIADGVFCLQGCMAVIPDGTYDSVTIDSGTAGMNRRDLIVVRYTRDTSTEVESMELAVIKGTPTSGSPQTPSYTSGDIQAGDTVVEAPLWRVNLTGVNVSLTRQATILNGEAETETLLSALNTTFGVWQDRIATAESDIDALETSVGGLTTRMTTAEGKLNQLVLWKNYTRQYTVAAGSNANITASQFGFTVPSGYATLGAIVASTGNGNCFLQGVYCNASGSSAAMIVHNTGTASVTATATLRIAYIRGSVFDAG